MKNDNILVEIINLDNSELIDLYKAVCEHIKFLEESLIEAEGDEKNE